MFEVFVEILILGSKEFVEGIGMVDIERRNKSWFAARTLVLQFRRVLVEHGLRERPNANEFDIAFEEVDEHWQFVEPILTHDAPPSGDTPVVVGLIGNIHSSTLVKDVVLDILGVRVHGASLVEIDYLLILAHARELNKRAVDLDLFLRIRLGVTMRKDVFDMAIRMTLSTSKPQ